MDIQKSVEHIWRIETADEHKRKPKRQKKVLVEALYTMNDILWDKLNGRLGEA